MAEEILNFLGNIWLIINHTANAVYLMSEAISFSKKLQLWRFGYSTWTYCYFDLVLYQILWKSSYHNHIVHSKTDGQHFSLNKWNLWPEPHYRLNRNTILYCTNWNMPFQFCVLWPLLCGNQPWTVNMTWESCGTSYLPQEAAQRKDAAFKKSTQRMTTPAKYCLPEKTHWTKSWP